MIGIYKITNKLNGKIYIGQSIHCGERFDQHCGNNSQLIDQTIQNDGIENFTFEILKTVENSNELNYWEDYYIIQYNSMYPNGYNRRWNTNHKDRSLIGKEKEEVPLIFEEKNEASSIGSILEELDKIVKESRFLCNSCVSLINKELGYLGKTDCAASWYTYEEWKEFIAYERQSGELNEEVEEYLKALLKYCQWWQENSGYKKIQELPDIQFSKSRYSPLQKERYKGLQTIVKKYNQLQLERKYETTKWFEEDIADRYHVPWRAFNGILEINGDSYMDFDMGTLAKKLKENHEEAIYSHFYISNFRFYFDGVGGIYFAPASDYTPEELKKELRSFGWSLYIK